MQHHNIAAVQASYKAKPQNVLKTKVCTILTYIFLVINSIALFIPLNPRMPSRGLDASWQFAMNQAVARHMSFGTQVMFTYGPLASIATRVYDPATDRRMLAGSFLLALSYSLALGFLAHGRGRYLLVGLLLLFATFANTEIFLLSYSFVFAICCFENLNSIRGELTVVRRWLRASTALVMLITLGLLPLIKGSLLLPFAAAIVIPSGLLFYRSQIRDALIVLVLPVASAIAFWILTGQRLSNLPAFLRGTVSLTSGYTEAMATSWLVLPAVVGAALVLVFIALTGLLGWSILRSRKLAPTSKWALALLTFVFLFVIFKHGFVKADEVPVAFESLSAVALILAFLVWDRYMVVAVAIAITIACGTSVMNDSVLSRQVHEKFGTGVAWGGNSRTDVLKFCMDRALGAYARSTYESAWNTYSGMWAGLGVRLAGGDELSQRFDAAESAIRNSAAIPQLQGSADIYNYDQAVLLASGNPWDPRPVLQSYSVYTPELAAMNEKHLRGSEAPDWVLFDLQTIDGRLPSLDDGGSWPALFDNYRVNSFGGQFALLERQQVMHSESSYSTVTSQVLDTGSKIAIPQGDGPLFAEVELKPTLAGRMLNTLFCPPELRIEVGLADGRMQKYRVVSEMMKTEFLLSPMVVDTKGFAALMSQGRAGAALPQVETISIAPVYGGSMFWSKSLQLTLRRYRNPGNGGTVGLH